MSAISGMRLFVRSAISNSFREEVVAAPVRAKMEALIRTDEKLRNYVQKHGANIFIQGTGIGPGGRFPDLKMGEWRSIVTNKPLHMMGISNDAGIYLSARYAMNMAHSTNRLETDGESEHIVDEPAFLFVLPENPEEIEQLAIGCPSLPAGKRCDVYAFEVSTEAKTAVTARSKLFLGMFGAGVVGGALYYQYEQTRANVMAEEKSKI